MPALSLQRIEERLTLLEALDLLILEAAIAEPRATPAAIAKALGCAHVAPLGVRFSRLVSLELLNDTGSYRERSYSASIAGANAVKLARQPWLIRAQRTRDHVRRLELPPQRAAA